MTNTGPIVFLAATILLGACSQSPAMPSPKMSAQAFQAMMIAEANLLTADYNSGDPAKLATHYAPDQVLMQDGGPNLDAAGAGGRRKEQTAFDVQLATSNIVVDAPASQDMATVRSTCIVSVLDKVTKQPVIPPQANNCLLGYRRQADGTMKVSWGVTVPTVAHTVK
jgi:ketosteroid isomerase-like protein